VTVPSSTSTQCRRDGEHIEAIAGGASMVAAANTFKGLRAAGNDEIEARKNLTGLWEKGVLVKGSDRQRNRSGEAVRMRRVSLDGEC
jgi:hypothetical protein